MSFHYWCKEFDKSLLEHSEVQQIFTLMGYFWPKYIMFGLKKYRGVIFFDTGEWCKISRRIDLSVPNWHEEFNEFWRDHSKISKICPLVCCLWPRYIIFEHTKYRWVKFDGTENWCKIWRKTDMCFQKWHEEFGNFSPEHSKVSKRGLWLDSLTQSRKCMSLKFTGELCIIAMKNDVKFEEELTCQFKIDMRDLMNFAQSTQKSQKFSL